MPWFQNICRKSGLLVHDVVHAGSKRRVTQKQVEEKQQSDSVTLRRTTIDEVEYRGSPPDGQIDHQDTKAPKHEDENSSGST